VPADQLPAELGPGAVRRGSPRTRATAVRRPGQASLPAPVPPGAQLPLPIQAVTATLSVATGLTSLTLFLATLWDLLPILMLPGLSVAAFIATARSMVTGLLLSFSMHCARL